MTAALAEPGALLTVPVALGAADVWDGFGLWLALTEPGACRLLAAEPETGLPDDLCPSVRARAPSRSPPWPRMQPPGLAEVGGRARGDRTAAGPAAVAVREFGGADRPWRRAVARRARPVASPPGAAGRGGVADRRRRLPGRRYEDPPPGVGVVRKAHCSLLVDLTRAGRRAERGSSRTAATDRPPAPGSPRRASANGSTAGRPGPPQQPGRDRSRPAAVDQVVDEQHRAAERGQLGRPLASKPAQTAASRWALLDRAPGRGPAGAEACPSSGSRPISAIRRARCRSWCGRVREPMPTTPTGRSRPLPAGQHPDAGVEHLRREPARPGRRPARAAGCPTRCRTAARSRGPVLGQLPGGDPARHRHAQLGHPTRPLLAAAAPRPPGGRAAPRRGRGRLGSTSAPTPRPVQLSQRPHGAASGSSSWRRRNSSRHSRGAEVLQHRLLLGAPGLARSAGGARRRRPRAARWRPTRP